MAKKSSSKRITVPCILGRKRELLSGKGAKISALTAYDYTFARLLDRAGVDVLLVGDSLGSVIQGEENTLPVTLEDIIYHTRCVVRGTSRALVVSDLPFMSYQVSVEKALESAGRLVKEGKASAVKLEGGEHMEETIRRIVEIDIPVMGHVGLTPQSFHRMGGHKLQGKYGSDSRVVSPAEKVVSDALAVERAGAFAVVLEGVPAEVAREITDQLSIPTIGIGAGAGCDGQILVSYDLLGLDPEFKPRFVRRFAELGQAVELAVRTYNEEVQNGMFPGLEQTVSQPRKAQLAVVKSGTEDL
ncbi:MAG: 3-methyl-2-oxobutanoate hydroxymethyltransferase [Bdellovibrionales bacterium]|nr:3-methyl-2-oxobutanoate hydroxymethyltransferase [Bdellovibrionales bacterium]